MKMKKTISLILVFSLQSFFVACTTPQSKALKEIHVGMDKADVLEIAGNPARISRHLGQDRWTYEDLSYKSTETAPSVNAKSQTTFVYFSDGRVTNIVPADMNPDSITSPTRSKNASGAQNENSGFKTVGE